MWIDNPTAETAGPITRRVTSSGVTVTLDATLASVEWDMGDGTTVTCAGSAATGTAYVDTYGLTESPSCGHVYERQADPYTITATSFWEVAWTDGVASGVIPVTVQNTTTRTIGELQAITVG